MSDLFTSLEDDPEVRVIADEIVTASQFASTLLGERINIAIAVRRLAWSRGAQEQYEEALKLAGAALAYASAVKPRHGARMFLRDIDGKRLSEMG